MVTMSQVKIVRDRDMEALPRLRGSEKAEVVMIDFVKPIEGCRVDEKDFPRLFLEDIRGWVRIECNDKNHRKLRYFLELAEGNTRVVRELSEYEIMKLHHFVTSLLIEVIGEKLDVIEKQWRRILRRYNEVKRRLETPIEVEPVWADEEVRKELIEYMETYETYEKIDKQYDLYNKAFDELGKVLIIIEELMKASST